MKNYQNVNREYVDPVQLDVLSKTYDTLEQGHQQTIKAESELRSAIAQMPFNEKDSWFRDKLVNEIQTTINNNTIYGNSYGALDDLVRTQGDIMSRNDVIGRIKSNEAKMQYDANVDKMDLPQGMKQMYKDANPYEYKDGEIDPNTGRVKLGTIWKPTTTPTKQINFYEVMSKVRQQLQAKTGGGTSIMFLDENDMPTPDINKSVDKRPYQLINGTWQVLSPERIRSAINNYINSNQEVQDSLKQDWNYAIYKYDKNEDVDGITDKNGKLYTYNQYVDNIINRFANDTQVNNSTRNITFGDASTQYARQLAINKAKGKHSSNSGSGYDDKNISYNSKDVGSNSIGFVKIEGNNYKNLNDTKSKSNAVGLTLARKYMGKDFGKSDSITDIMNILGVDSPGIAANTFIQKYGKNMGTDEKRQLINSFIGYWQSNNQISKLFKDASVEDKEALLFNANISNGEYTNDNKYGKEILGCINNLIKRNPNGIDYVIDKECFTNMNDNDINILLNTGKVSKSIDKDNNIILHFNPEAYSQLPKFQNDIDVARDMSNGSLKGWFINKLGGVGKGNYKINGNIYNRYGTEMKVNILNNLAKAYKNGLEKAKSVQSKFDVSSNSNFIEINPIDANSITEMDLRNKLNNGYIDEKEFKSSLEYATKYVDNQFATHNFALDNIYDFSNSSLGDVKVENKQTLSNLINYMYNNHSNNITRQVYPNAKYIDSSGNEVKGYVLSFNIPDDAIKYNSDFGKLVTDKDRTIKLLVTSNGIKEPTSYDYNREPSFIADNKINIANATNTNIEVLGYSPNLGNTNIRNNGNGDYSSSQFGKIVHFNKDVARGLIMNNLAIQQLKYEISSGTLYQQLASKGYNDNEIDNTIKAIIENYSRPLAVTFGISQQSAFDNVYNYIVE